jgi:hypothetical protein
MYRVPVGVTLTTGTALEGGGGGAGVLLAPGLGGVGVIFTNPGLGQVLADTGPLRAGVYALDVHAENSVGAIVTTAIRNAANTADIVAWRTRLGTGNYDRTWIGLPLALANQRIRVTLDAAVVGEVQVVLFAVVRSEVFKL